MLGATLALCLLPAYILRGFQSTWFTWTLEKQKQDIEKDELFSGIVDTAILSFFPAIAWGLLILPEVFFDEKNNTWLESEKTVLLLLIPIFFICAVRGWKQFSRYKWNSRIFWEKLGLRGTGLAMWVIVFLTPYFMASVFARAGDKESEWAVFFGGALLFGMINTFAYFAKSKQVWAIIFFSTMTIAYVLPLMGGNITLWPEAIVRKLALGSRNAVNISIASKQCNALHPFNVSCKPSSDKDAQITLQNVNVLSRVGTSVLLELMAEYEDTSPPPMTLKEKKEVNSDRTHNFPVEGTLPLSGSLKAHPKDYESFCQNVRFKESKIQYCGVCEKRILERVEKVEYAVSDTKITAENKQTKIDTYKQNLVCVRLAVPKDQIASLSLGGKREYIGHTSYSLPPVFEDKKDSATTIQIKSDFCCPKPSGNNVKSNTNKSKSKPSCTQPTNPA